MEGQEDKPIHRALMCMLQAEPERGMMHTSVKPITFDSVEGLETHQSPERDLIVLTTCLGTLIREVEEQGLMKKGQAMAAAIKCLENVYMTNDIELTLNKSDAEPTGTVR